MDAWRNMYGPGYDAERLHAQGYTIEANDKDKKTFDGTGNYTL